MDHRINACRQRLRHHRATQKTKAAPPDATPPEASEASGASAPLPAEPRMSSIAEILSSVAGELAWLETGPAPLVDERPQGETGLSLQEEVGRA